MSAETIPALLPEGYSVDYGSHRTWMSAFRGRLISGWGDKASAIKACWDHAGIQQPADRSTRPAEPAPEVEVGDGRRLPLARELHRYANCSPEAVSSGSPAQMLYFVRDAKLDIATLAAMLSHADATLEAERAKTAAAKAEIARRYDDLKRACDRAGVCMTCVHGHHEPAGCWDCRNTGWVWGDPYEQADAAKAEADKLAEANARNFSQSQANAKRIAELEAIVEKMQTSASASVSRERQRAEHAIEQQLLNERRYQTAEASLSRVLQDREADREVLSQAEAGLAAMLRLADMGFEESLSEPEENGNFAAYEEGKRCLDQVRALLRADQRAGDGEATTPSVKQEKADRGYGLGFTRGMTAEQLDEAERHCSAMFVQRGDHGGSPGEYWAEALMEIKTARARRAGDGGAA